MDDGTLLAAWQAGDRSAGDRLMRRHYDAVRRFFELKATAAADDLTQRTLLACLESIDRLREHSSFRAFLFGIARNHYLRFKRDVVRFDAQLHFREDTVTPRHTGVSTLVARRDEHRLVLRAMAELPDDLAQTLQLFYWEGLRAVEIGEVMSISTSTVTTRTSRARKLLEQTIVTLSKTPQLGVRTCANLDEWARSVVARGPVPA